MSKYAMIQSEIGFHMQQRGDRMTTVTQADVDGVAETAKRFIAKLSSMPEEEAKAYSKDVLIQIGALDKNGQVKEQIVTGDFFGWQ